MIGHLKIVLILTGGFVLFRDPISFEQFLGMCMSITGIDYTFDYLKYENFNEFFVFLFQIKGVVLYSIFVQKNNNNKKPTNEKEAPVLPVTVNDTKN